MFSLRQFIKSGFLAAIGSMADYRIILNAAGWYDKGVLTAEDLEEIQTALAAGQEDDTASVTADAGTPSTQGEGCEEVSL